MNKYSVQSSKRYRKQYKLLKKRGYNLALLDDVITLLSKGEPLPSKYSDHPLKGNLSGYRDCHIKDDWVLLYRYDNNDLILLLFQTGTHSDILE